MKILVLGGTRWLGGEIVAEALRHGHDVTCLARGDSGAVPPGADLVRADRDADDAFDTVPGGWDVVVDVARQPGHVRRAVAALADRAGRYVFVSSGSVYADDATPGLDESAELLPVLDSDVMAGPEDYGSAKVACERHVLAGFGPGRCLIARAGLIGGPGDHTGRTGYWPLRFHTPAVPDGRVLVPDAPDLATQVVDVRDLAAWLVGAGTGGVSGTFDAVGERYALPEHLAVAREVAGHTGTPVPVDQDWLAAHGVRPWMGQRSLPLWLPLPEYAGLGSRDGSAARAAGLTHRPLRDTLADTLAWELAQGADRPRGAGLTVEEERELLADVAA
jgi:2'-hydroxyisoflavone reductase